MDGGAPRDADRESSAVTPELLADLQAGLLDDATAARVRRHVRTDPEAARILTGLEEVRHDLAELGVDAQSAPPVHPDVTARIAAALRAAPPHTRHAANRPTLTGPQRVAAAAGVIAAAVGVVSVLTMNHREPAPMFGGGPTASQITVSRGAPPPFPLSDVDLRDILKSPLNPGPLGDPQRLASCLAGLGYTPTAEVLGARPVDHPGFTGVVLLLPGDSPDHVTAVLVAATCSRSHTDLLAQTQLVHP